MTLFGVQARPFVVGHLLQAADRAGLVYPALACRRASGGTVADSLRVFS